MSRIASESEAQTMVEVEKLLSVFRLLCKEKGISYVMALRYNDLTSIDTLCDNNVVALLGLVKYLELHASQHALDLAAQDTVLPHEEKKVDIKGAN